MISICFFSIAGAMSPVKRDQLWLEKQLFFLTPQTMSNDLLRAAVDPKSIRLLVIDEAHKARGSYAYCTVVTEILKHQNQFRVLALTATPGSETKVVQDVVNNLKISHIESRSEQQLSEYCHDRNVQKHVVALEGPILEIRTQFLGKVSSVYRRTSAEWESLVLLVKFQYPCLKWCFLFTWDLSLNFLDRIVFKRDNF